VIESSGSLTVAQENFFLITIFTIGYVLVTLNPISAAIASEVILLSEQKLIFTTIPIGNNVQYPIVSPWIPYTMLALVLGLVLVRLTIAFVRRIER
jgi:hypothetical protein